MTQDGDKRPANRRPERAAAPDCWSCAAPVTAGDVKCAACGKVQPAGRATPFERLGLPATLDIDDKELERAWLQRSRQVHPDRFARASDAEKRYAAEQTAALNDAYRAVKDPFDRASWLVDAALGGATTDKGGLDPALLVELMEARERAEGSAEEAARVVDESKARFAALMASLGPALAEPRKAARVLAEMKTLARLVADLGGGKLIATLSER